MKLLVCLLGLALLAVVRAQSDVDVEGLREILQSLLQTGQPVNAESLNSISQSFSGVEKDILTRYTQQLENAKEAEELLLHDEILDLETFKNLLFNLKALGVTIRPSVPVALLGVIDDPSERILAPTVAQWSKANLVSLTDSLKTSLNAAVDAIRQVITGTSGTVRERLRAKAASLPAGIAKSILAGIDADLEKISQQQGGTFSFSMDHIVPMSEAEVVRDASQVNKVLNREIVQFLSGCLQKMTKAQAKQQVEILLRKVYDNTELPAVLNAVLSSLQ